MKQHISIADLNELTDKQKEKLREWWKPQQGDIFCLVDENYKENLSVHSYDLVEDKVFVGYDLDDSEGNFYDYDYSKLEIYPLLDIGQMIEFIGDDFYNALQDTNWGEIEYETPIEKVCDALWEVVKLLLSKTN